MKWLQYKNTILPILIFSLSFAFPVAFIGTAVLRITDDAYEVICRPFIGIVATEFENLDVSDCSSELNDLVNELISDEEKEVFHNDIFEPVVKRTELEWSSLAVHVNQDFDWEENWSDTAKSTLAHTRCLTNLKIFKNMSSLWQGQKWTTAVQYPCESKDCCSIGCCDIGIFDRRGQFLSHYIGATIACFFTLVILQKFIIIFLATMAEEEDQEKGAAYNRLVGDDSDKVNQFVVSCIGHLTKKPGDVQNI